MMTTLFFTYVACCVFGGLTAWYQIIYESNTSDESWTALIFWSFSIFCIGFAFWPIALFQEVANWWKGR